MNRSGCLKWSYLCFTFVAIIGFCGNEVYAVCAPRVSHLNELNSFVEETALVIQENRQIRTPEDIGDDETVQGRIWCFSDVGIRKVPERPTKAQLRTAEGKAVATLQFEEDVALVNRHSFLDEFNREVFKPENCFFEHIASGDIIRGTRFVKYAPYYLKGNQPDYVDYRARDVAVWRLSRRPQYAGIKLIGTDRFVIDHNQQVKAVKVVSNYANNFRPPPSRELNKEALTIADCSYLEDYAPQGVKTNIVFSNCNTGGGSSGSLVYAEVNGERKILGMIASEHNNGKAGAGFVKNVQDTIFVRFDPSSLVKLYQNLPKTDNQASTEGR